MKNLFYYSDSKLTMFTVLFFYVALKSQLAEKKCQIKL